MKQICEHCGSEYEVVKPKPAKHVHDFDTEDSSGWFNVVGGVRTSHVQFCKGCPVSREVPVGADTHTKGPKVFGLSSGERLNR